MVRHGVGRKGAHTMACIRNDVIGFLEDLRDRLIELKGEDE